eukprot:7723650-Prorocentrum_lima.AAC.1
MRGGGCDVNASASENHIVGRPGRSPRPSRLCAYSTPGPPLDLPLSFPPFPLSSPPVSCTPSSKVPLRAT